MTLWINNSEPVELNSNATETELQAVIYAVYRQVLGNAHVMESQRLSSFELLLILTSIDRCFLKAPRLIILLN
jgi:phycoerythrin-associated linker protein